MRQLCGAKITTQTLLEGLTVCPYLNADVGAFVIHKIRHAKWESLITCAILCAIELKYFFSNLEKNVKCPRNANAWKTHHFFLGLRPNFPHNFNQNFLLTAAIAITIIILILVS